jgi:hypothetical protein
MVRRLTVLGIFCGCIQAFAWSAEGHRLVARIAAEQLTPEARARVAAILGPGETLASIAPWADEARRQRPATAPWHYINIPISRPRLDMARDCPKGDCVLAKIEDFRKALRDPGLNPAERREALMFLVHFVGDMHQPLHCSDNGDRGGNDVPVLVPAQPKPTNLHSAWDGALLRRAGTEDELFPLLSREALKHKKWAKGTVSQWAGETHQATRKVVYGRLPMRAGNGVPVTLSAGYERRAVPLMEKQIERAGDRLARILNETLQ